MKLYYESELRHHGVKGMKWGVRKKYPDRLNYPKKSSSTTRKVIDDYNSLSDKEFKGKYQTSKKTYAKRVEKYGDPYMNAPMAKMGKTLKKHKGKIAAAAIVTGVAAVGAATYLTTSSKGRDAGRLITESVLGMMGHRDITWLD